MLRKTSPDPHHQHQCYLPYSYPYVDEEVSHVQLPLNKHTSLPISKDNVSYDWQKRNLKAALDPEPIDPNIYKDDTELKTAAQ